MTLHDLEYRLCMYFPIHPQQIRVTQSELNLGMFYLVIDADILSQDVNRLLREISPITLRWIVVTAGWRY